MPGKMTRGDVLRKCIIVFDAIRRHASKGNAGLEPAKGAEDSFEMDQEICDVLRQMLIELESGKGIQDGKAEDVTNKVVEMNDWQEKIIEWQGPPPKMTL